MIRSIPTVQNKPLFRGFQSPSMFALGEAIFNLCLKLLFGRNSLYKGVQINTYFFSGILRLKLRRFGRKNYSFGSSNNRYQKMTVKSIYFNELSCYLHAGMHFGNKNQQFIINYIKHTQRNTKCSSHCFLHIIQKYLRC